MLQAIQHKIVSTDENPLWMTKTGVLKVLAYFDIFHYPLKTEEIARYFGQLGVEDLLKPALEELVNEGIVFYHADFYSLHNNPLLISRRIKANQRATLLLPEAVSIGRFLYSFPFVRGIGVSGSLSKDVADENADFDFFIITKRNRLWIARTIMHIFKKFTYLTGKQHSYCMNYYIDEDALLLADQNIFTAIEIKTLLPVSGHKSFEFFFQTNSWCNQWLPACEYRKQAQADPANGIFKRIFEWIFTNGVGDKLDNFFFNLTTRRWKQKEASGKLNVKGARLGLVTGKHFAKSNPGGFQERVLTLYQQKLEMLGVECRI